MSRVRKFFTSFGINILLLISITLFMGLGYIFYDIVSDTGKIERAEWILLRTADDAVERIEEQIADFTRKEDYESLRSLAEKYNFEYSVYSKNGRPIVTYGSLKKQAGEVVHKFEQKNSNGDAYEVKYLIHKEQFDQPTIVWANIRYFLENNAWLIIVLMVALLVAFVFESICFTRQASGAYKFGFLMVILTMIEAGALYYGWTYCGSVKERILIVLGLVAEKVVLVIIGFAYIGKIAGLHRNVRAIGNNYASKSVPTEKFPACMKAFAKDIEAASDNIDIAVKERLKSEKLKTELVSNVSHDLKTPLTSIINFSDLILQEKSDNEAITEYSEHLHRQSVRIKELLESLLEASKAQAGTVDINMVSCNLGTLVDQCMVEYEEKLANQNITLVDLKPVSDVLICADVKALSRIFDNLISNICKYSLPGTKAYIEAKSDAEKAYISFKNVTREPIYVPADELAERFVRGDSSRHSEGYGLGLSIVKNLMELMDGEMKLSAEFDIFTVSLVFPLLTND